MEDHDNLDHCQAVLRTTGKKVWFQPQNNLRSGGVHSALSPPTLAGDNASELVGGGVEVGFPHVILL